MTYARKVTLGLILAATLAAVSAQAETVFVVNKPTTTIKIGQAMKSKTPVASCSAVKMGESGRPKKISGASTLWLAEMPKADESAIEKLSNGEKVYQCKSMEFNAEKGRMGAASIAE